MSGSADRLLSRGVLLHVECVGRFRFRLRNDGRVMNFFVKFRPLLLLFLFFLWRPVIQMMIFRSMYVSK